MAQTPSDESPWGLTIQAFFTRPIDEDPMPLTLGGGIGLRRRLGAKTGLTAEVAYLPMGPHTEVTRVEGFGIYSQYRHHRVWRMGLTADLALTRGAIRPTFLIGAAITHFDYSARTRFVDTVGTDLLNSSERKDHWAIGPSLGVALGLPRVRALFTPTLELRGHAAASRSYGEWSAFTFVTLGLTLRH
jgi:hypothetical protein